MYRDHLVSLLKRNVKPALGCTEPAAIALAVSRAQEESRGDIRDVRVRLSGNIFKNARGVGIPGTSEYGIEFAVALALACGDWHKGLEVFADVNEDAVSRDHALLDAVPIQVGLCDAEENFFIEAVVSGAQGTGRAVIIGGHTNMVLVERDGKTVEEAAPAVAEDGKKSAVTPILKDMTIQELRQEVEALPLEEIAFLIAGVPMNYRMAQAGLDQMPGLGLGAALRRLMDEGAIEENMVNKVRMYAAAAADARMAGLKLPVMSSAGSGNHGITAILPPYLVCREKDLDEEKLIRALALSHLVTIAIKEFSGPLSPVCGRAIAAGVGAAAAGSFPWALRRAGPVACDARYPRTGASGPAARWPEPCGPGRWLPAIAFYHCFFHPGDRAPRPDCCSDAGHRAYPAGLFGNTPAQRRPAR